MKGSIIDDDRSGAMRLSVEELQRYSRHLIMPEVRSEGQNRLKAARVLCIGAGGLGSPAALYLAAAGVTEQRTSVEANWSPRGIGCTTSIRRSRPNCTSAVSPVKTHLNLSPSTTWLLMDRIIFRRDICQTTSVFSRTSRMCTAQYSGLRDRQPFSPLI